MIPGSALQPASWATTHSAAPYATVLTPEAVPQGNLFWQNSRCLIVWAGMVQQNYQLALGWGQRKGGSGEEGSEEMKSVCVCACVSVFRGMAEADLATVMEWDFEWEVLVGEGVEGREREGIVTVRRQAGVRRSVTSFFPPL